MLAAGEDVVVLDKFTYAGNPANLPEDIELPPRRHRDRARMSTRSARSMRSSTSPPRRTWTARSSGPEDFVRTDVLGTLVAARRRAEALSARFVQVSDGRGLRRRRAGLVVARGRSAAPLEPVQRGEGRRRPAGARGGADVRRQRIDHARLEHVRARTSIRRRCCRSSRRTRSTASRCRSTATAGRCGTGSMSTTTARRSSSCSAQGRRARSTTSARARSTRTSSSRG